MIQQIHSEEAAFHDRWAKATVLEDVSVLAAFESPTALENAFVLEQMGRLQGKRILDVGAGLGESSVYFALQGARVTCTDVSPEMVDFACRLARHNGVELNGVVAAGEHLDVPEDYFDFAYVANTIHHVGDKRQLFQQIHSALRPGGRFFSIDPLRYNPVIKIYRRMATEVRTVDEAPLSFDDVEIMKEYFQNVQHREFWILSLALFLKYYLVDRIHPNRDRYWKRIYREGAGELWWWLPLRNADEFLTHVPGIRRLAWNMVAWGEKPR